MALPLLISCKARAFPMPELPPVIMTTKPSNLVVQRQIPPPKYRLQTNDQLIQHYLCEKLTLYRK